MGQKLFLKDGNQIWVHAYGRTFTLPTNPQGRSSLIQGAGHGKDISGQIRSPMPGKILKIHVKINEQVNDGDAVCIIEAMKMEYTLKAQVSGVVKKLMKAGGDTVELGELILEISPK